MKTFLFYDIETTGLNKAFDQILQFAAIRTDEALNELERHEIVIKLNPDLIPSPGAIITHRIDFDSLQNGLREVEAIQTIHKLLNTPDTISLGYNTLEFDDEFLRFSFYRNLLPPYTHQYANGCSRMDLYPMAIMYYLFKENTIHWPIVNGKPSFKLEHINEANHFIQGQSHQAIVDVEITIALARRLLTDKEMWDYVIGYFNKTIDNQRISKLSANFSNYATEYPVGILIDGKCGTEAYYQCPVLYLGQHNYYKNQNLWLRLDKVELSACTLEDISSAWVIRKKLGETGLLLPLIPRFMKYIDSIREGLILSNLEWLQKNPAILKAIMDYHKDYTYPKIPNLDPEAALYDNGFLKDIEQALCAKFHQAAPQEKSAFINAFTNPILKELAIRLMARNYPEFLSTQQAQSYQNYLKLIKSNKEDEILVNYKGHPRLTPQKALAEIVQLRNTDLDTEQRQLLEQLTEYIDKNFKDENNDS